MQVILIIGNLSPANKPHFNEAEALLREKGYSVINPVKTFTLSMNDHAYFLSRYLDALSNVNAVYFLPDFYCLPYAKEIQCLVKPLNLITLNSEIPSNLLLLQSFENDHVNF